MTTPVEDTKRGARLRRDLRGRIAPRAGSNMAIEAIDLVVGGAQDIVDLAAGHPGESDARAILTAAQELQGRVHKGSLKGEELVTALKDLQGRVAPLKTKL